MKLSIGLLPFQFKFLKSRSKFLWLRAGLGAGKSFVASQYAITRMLENPETTGLICASTYGQLRDSILSELFRQLNQMGLTYEYSTLTGFLTLNCNGARVKTFSLDNYEVLRGIEVGWIVIDEACLAKEAAYNVAIGRLRCPRSQRLECRIVSTPRGYDYIYDRYMGELWTPEHEEIHATALENFYLPEGYIASLAANYSPKMYRQEVLAEIVSAADGLVYCEFDRSLHVRPTLQRAGLPIRLGQDYNVSPHSTVITNVEAGKIYVFDELYLLNSNTYNAAQELRKRFPHDAMTVAPDATGSSRKTSATQSDHQIMRNAGVLVQTSRRNPAIEDRYNSVNAAFREGRIQIDPKCKMLIRDLERVAHEKNPSGLTHISDALGYLVWHLFPLKRPAPQSKVHRR